jgi:DNA ligase 1
MRPIPEDYVKKPLLAPNTQVEFTCPDIRWPMLASRKLDGYRCLIIPTYTSPGPTVHMVSRSFKQFANHLMLEERFAKVFKYALHSTSVLDCEIFSETLNFQEIGSCLSKAGKVVDPSIKLYCFDQISSDRWAAGNDRTPYITRYKHLVKGVRRYQEHHEVLDDTFEVLDQVSCSHGKDVENTFNLYTSMGDEGIILRSERGRYKNGRATVRESLIYKFKVRATADAQIIALIPGTTTKKSAERDVDAFGHRKFAGKKGDRIEVDRLGGIQVRLEDGTMTKIGIAASYSDDEYPDADSIWKNKEDLIGTWVEFEYLPVGVKDKPRFGRMIRIRRDKGSPIPEDSIDKASEDFLDGIKIVAPDLIERITKWKKDSPE